MQNITYYLSSGANLWNVFRFTLENTFLGSWVWVILLILVDFAVFIKSKNILLTAFVSTALTYLFRDFLPPNVFIFVIIFSAIGFGALIIEHYW